MIACPVCRVPCGDEARFCPNQHPLHGQQAPRASVDLVFCFDCTGSMGGEIRDLQANAIRFAGELNENGVGFQMGLIEFRDLNFDEPPDRNRLACVVPFTANAAAFREGIEGLRACGGGGDGPESSFDALWEALALPGHRPGVRRYLVLVTDNHPHEPDARGRTVDQLAGALAQQNVRLMIVGPPNVPQYVRLVKLLGSRAELVPIEEDGRRADFGRILTRVVHGTVVAVGRP